MGEPMTDAETHRRKAAFVKASAEQPHRVHTYASELLGIHRTSLKRWLDKERSHMIRNGVSSETPPTKPRYRIPALSRPHAEEGPIIRVMAMGDPHDKPGRCKKRFTWMGRHAAETRPDYVVSIGDWASLDSLSTHEQPGSQNDADRCPFHEELDSLDESLHLFGSQFDGIPRLHTHGNHEHRAWRAANRQPKANGDLPLRLDQAFARHGFETRPFGEFVGINGVDFVHIPLSIMGKEMGGEMMERNAGMKSLRDLVCGHTHRANLLTVMKVGQQRQVKVLNLGTSMPYGVVEKYTGLAPTGWFYGIHDIRIRDGKILSVQQLDMLLLEERYGD
jgi:hypothetical protein